MATANVDHRTAQIRNGLESLYQLDKQIEDLMEEHIAPLRQEKRDIKKRLRDEFDVPTKRLNGRYAQYREERRAIDNSDETTLEAIRYLYSVAEVGQQMDWLQAAGDEDDDDARPQFLRDKTAAKDEAEAQDDAA